MEKTKVKSRLLCAILCIALLALAFAAVFCQTNTAKADEPAPDTYYEPDVVLDSIEDFIVELDENGVTYSIPDIYKSEFKQGTTPGMIGQWYYNIGSSLSNTALEKLLGDEYKNKGKNRDELIDALKDGKAADVKFKIVIPSNISYVGDNAFVTSYIEGDTPPIQSRGYISNKRALDVFVQQMGLDQEIEENYDDIRDRIDPDSEKNYPEHYSELNAEQKREIAREYTMLIIFAEEGFTEDILFDFLIGPDGYDLPSLVAIEFDTNEYDAQDPDKPMRALTDLGYSVFGCCTTDELAYVPCSRFNVSFSEVMFNTAIIPNGVIEICENAFRNCSNMRSITIAESVKYIGRGAFSACMNLDDITFLGDNIQIDQDAFQLLKIYGENGNVNVHINSIDQWLSFTFANSCANPLYAKDYGCEARLVIGGVPLNEITVPATTNEVHDYAFTGGTFESITFAGRISKIGTAAFEDCDTLETVNMTDVISIGESAFRSSGIKSINIPVGLERIEKKAFSSCKKLETIIFDGNSKLTYIGDSAFYESGIRSITIPAMVTTIADSAFGNNGGTHSNLESVAFEVGSRLTTIGQYAFCHNTKLASIALPDKVTTVGKNAFAGCAADLAVGVKMSVFVSGNVSFGSPLFNGAYERGGTVVFNNYALASEFKKTFEEPDGVHKGETNVDIAYPVQVKYYISGTDAGSSTYMCKYNVADTLALSAASDKWYSDEACNNEIAASDLISALKTESSLIKDGVIKLYAQNRTGELVFAGKSDLVYDGNSYTLDSDEDGINKLLADTSAKIASDMTVSIVSYTNASGAISAVPQTISDAGTYAIAVQYGDKTANFEIVIGRQKIDISGLQWTITQVGDVVGGDQLTSSTLYLYIDTTDPTTTYASLERLDTAQPAYSKYTLSSVTNVSNAIARFHGDDKAISVAIKDPETDKYAVQYGGQYSQAELGVYNAQALITPTNNYELTVSRTDDFYLRGITMLANNDGTYTLTKRWYVVSMTNWLVGERPSDGDVSGYVFDGNCEFGNGIDFTTPYIMYGDVADSVIGTINDPLQLRLYSADRMPLTEAFSRTEMSYYLNSALPVGDYILEISVANLTHEGAAIAGFTQSYMFTVAPLDMPSVELDSLLSDIQGKEFVLEWGEQVRLLDAIDSVSGKFDELKNAIADMLSDMLPDQENAFWTTSYDTGFTITYNMDRLRDDNYFGADEFNGKTTVEPDLYTVYFNITVNNFGSLTNVSSEARRTYKFDIKVVRKVELPTVANVVYTGSEVRPVIVGNAFYTYSWDSADTYTAGGTHKVTFTLNDNEFYYWVDGEGNKLSGATADVNFQITAADNKWINDTINIIWWNYGGYTKTDNIISAIPTFIDNGQAVKFYISSDAAGENKIAGLEEFTVNANGEIVEDIAAKLNSLDAGTYYLNALLAATDNYKKLETTGFSFEIAPAANDWKTTLTVTTWVEGRMDKIEYEEGAVKFPVTVEAYHGNENVIVKLYDMSVQNEDGSYKLLYEGKNDPNNEEYVDILKGLKVGRYYITASLAASGNYAGIPGSDPIFFEVFEAPGLPWWAILLIALGSVGLVVGVFLILWKKGVFRIITDKILVAIRTKVSVDSTIAAVRAQKLQEEIAASRAAAIAKEQAEENREKAKQAAAAYRALPAEEKAKKAEDKAKAALARAEKARQHAELMQAKANRMSERAAAEIAATTPPATEEPAAPADTSTDSE